MRKDLDDLLCRRYPDLFADRHGDMRTTAMCWGFSCGDGWCTLIDALCAEIRRHASETNTSAPVVQQVKEKFGSLRYYVAGGDDWIHDLIWFSDYLSGVICEECGAPGYLAADADWYRTRCVAHGGKAPPVVRIAEPRAFVMPPIAAPGWRHLAQALEACVENDIQRNGLDPVVVDRVMEGDDTLLFASHGGGDRVAAWIQLLSMYSLRVDSITGKPRDEVPA
ncbi:hypothetical protein AzCIB_1397 [Azoarcus sp. CIB]|uniref:hypothetical protein n=1 Tax=Aromatoleum sp. (strain CIB) TaxID=198107 RepID=UPI00067D211B|nr:hypothetical protein [Azoarcus sp. CIB]AKU11299.1 hypothetical protein AzCIB_1397 [Azoarcus sp. CIB]